MTGADPARRSQLLGLKLAALVREHLGSEAPIEPGTWPGGAALVSGDASWVLAEQDPQRALGRALAWARQHGSVALNVIAEQSGGLLARRATHFTVPPTVWSVDGRRLEVALAESFPRSAYVDPALVHLAELIERGGADVVVEHGVLTGEVQGLEVCRAVRDAYTDECRLEVGVGKHDREAFLLMHGGVPTVDALRKVVSTVAGHRAPGAELHPLNRLGAERAIRSRLLREPALVGVRSLDVANPPVARANLKDAVPCVALGEDPDGEPVVVVCSTGIDLDVVPWAADARAALTGQTARLVIAVPERDASSITIALAAALRHPATVVGLPAH